LGRPKGAEKTANLTKRMRAYEMFVAGAKKATIARELGVTKATIGAWAREDAWEGRLVDIVATANAAAEYQVGDQVAATLLRLKSQMTKRVAELETLCGPANHPSVRLRAIQVWLKLAGVDQALPNPLKPGEGTSLQLVEDLVKPSEETEDE
jgi:DNA-binding XRE family transcriptional regulator